MKDHYCRSGSYCITFAKGWKSDNKRPVDMLKKTGEENIWIPRE